MRFSLAQLWRRTRNPRRREVVLRPVVIPATMAGDLYRAGYSDVVAIWASAIDPIIAAYERSLSELTQDSPQEIGSIVSSVESTVLGLLLTVRLRLERWAQNVERLHRMKWRLSVLSASGVDINTMIGPEDVRTTLGAAIEANVGLIRSVSDQARQRISNEVFEGLRARKPAREVAAAIREDVGMSRRRALMIASDQTVKITESLNEARRSQAGISTWEWVSSHKLHFRPEHAVRDGKRYDDDAKSGAHKPPADRPGQLIHCGCTSRAVLSLDGEF